MKLAFLPTLQGPSDLRGLTEEQLQALAAEIRECIISTVAKTGGHLGSSLGVVELTLALHRVLESPRDRIVWDTGHQAYAHKLLTGRYSKFGTLRQLGGIGGFPRRIESEHDVFDGGHAGTGLSIAQGLATARDLRHSMERIAVVVGDAALISGLSLEALNDIGHRQTQLLIVLNDNAMSISPTVGAFSQYFSTLKLSTAWQQSKTAYDKVVESLPVVGRPALKLSRRIRRMVVSFAQPGQLFEDLGITYLGVIPGHNRRGLEHIFRAALDVPGPVIVHVRTRKGRGYRPAERDQIGFHGAALPPMPDLATAPTPTDAHAQALTGLALARVDNALPQPGHSDDAPMEPADATGGGDGAGGSADMGTPSNDARVAAAKRPPNYTYHFSRELIELAHQDRRIVAITAGMPTGTGLHTFQAEFPDRFIDVGIAEQHAVAMAAGMALAGERPVVALYSTFLQRAFDQEVHDVCQNDLPVVIAVDRAGLVGEDGTSHQGMFTLPTQLQLPTMVVASPKDEQELRSMVKTAFAQDHPFALHYPRDPGFGVPEEEPKVLKVGVGEVLREGKQVLIIGFGPIVDRGRQAADILEAEGWSVALMNARFAKPLDRQLILDQARGKALVVTLEESVVTGGFGAGVLDVIEGARMVDPAYREVSVRVVGIPAETFVEHGSVDQLRELLKLDAAGIAGQIRETLGRLRAVPSGAPSSTPSGARPAAKAATTRSHSR
ncbi:MAG TPA: 1-deoxy-D-xylulose-5-phosphate synthase [Candidatus Limnocylindrales bacterium]